MMKVLVVDDAPMVRKILRSILSKGMGVKNVEEASDGQVALAMIKRIDYDLVITDWNMPKMTGLEMVKAVRSLPGEKSKTPILMVTAEAKKENIIQALKSGVNNYLVKPFTAESVKKKVESVLGVKK